MSRHYDYLRRRCNWCDQLFWYIRRGTRYCSNSCRAQGYRKKHAAAQLTRKRKKAMKQEGVGEPSGLLVPTEARVLNPGGFTF